jgi:hypothetical protein
MLLFVQIARQARGLPLPSLSLRFHIQLTVPEIVARPRPTTLFRLRDLFEGFVEIGRNGDRPRPIGLF